MKFPVLWSGLVSRVGASHRVNLMHLSPLDRNAQENYYDYDIGDHPTVVTCLPIAAESFKLKSGLIVQMDGRKAKFSQFIFQNCSPAMLLTKCL